MVDKTALLTEIISDVVRGARVDDRERVRQLLVEHKSQLEEALVPSGHSFVDGRLRSSMSEAGWINEQLNGVTYLLYLRELLADFDHQWPRLQDGLLGLMRSVFTRQQAIVNLTVDASSIGQVSESVSRLVSLLTDQAAAVQNRNWNRHGNNEAFIVPSQVNYVGRAANLHNVDYQFHGSSLVITRFLRTGWLWDQVRVQGGAYGAFCKLNRLSGVISFLSYRDPNLLRTVEKFEQISHHLQTLDISQHEIDKHILGAIGDLDAYMLADAKGYVAMVRRFTGQTPQMLNEIRSQVFDTKLHHFRQFGETLNQLDNHWLLGVLGGEQAIRQAEGRLNLSTMTLL